MKIRYISNASILLEGKNSKVLFDLGLHLIMFQIQTIIIS